jgi:hypothetical protein
MKKVAIGIITALAFTYLLPADDAAAQANRHRVITAPADISHILTGFSAKETCSCVFAVGQTDDYCKAFGQQAGFDAIVITIDRSGKKVTATYDPKVSAVVTRTATATAGQGCALDSY